MPKADLNKAGWEVSGFPCLCKNCLGSDPFIRMSKQDYGAECKMCKRPFTVFKYQADKTAGRFKKTEVCGTCAKIKNCCQTCLLDLQFGMPTALRDHALGLKASVAGPSSNINREYFVQNHEAKLGSAETLVPSTLGRNESAGRSILKNLAQTQAPYPLIETQPQPDTAAQQTQPEVSGANGQNTAASFVEAVAQEQLQVPAIGSKERTPFVQPQLVPPTDQSIVSLYLSQLPDTASQEKIRAQFESFIPMDDIKAVIHVKKTKNCFVNFVNREAAELAAKRVNARGFAIDDEPVKVIWGRSRPKASAAKAT